MTTLLIRNARIAQEDGSKHDGDVLCINDKIERIANQIDYQADETIDAEGHLLLPGVIDPQVHFREPGNEHKENLGSGSRAAVRGGVTSFLEMPNTRPATTTQAALDDKLKRASEKCVANYGFFIGATAHNLDALNSVEPACGIKIFMGSSTGDLLVNDAKDLENIFAHGERLIAVHAEDEARIQARQQQFSDRTDAAAHSEIRDNECARLATELALSLSKKYSRRLHILHLSTHEEVDMLRRDKPEWVTAEALPNHLLLNIKDYEKQGALVQMNPPIRQPQDNEARPERRGAGFYCHRPRPAHTGRKTTALSQNTLGHARGRNLSATHAYRDESRKMYVGGYSEMDVLRTGRSLPHPQQRQDY